MDLGTRLLIESMILPKVGRILDIGCGYGPIGIVAAKIEPNLEVWMTDINRRAVSLAKKNVELSSLKGFHVCAGELFKPVHGLKFDTILANPPISAGMRNVVKPLILGAYDHLAAGGSLQLVAQWNKGGKTISSTIESRFDNIDTLARGAGYHVMKAVKE
jgi:16S rRNA G1207 methylase RsmC